MQVLIFVGRAASISEALTPPVEVLPYEFSQGGASGEGFCTGDLGIDDILLDGVGSEQLSNASVYHANFEKIQVINNANHHMGHVKATEVFENLLS